ncbi:hypothetical protein [Sphaerotilus montanus]|uniref:hypothetical protein n=1 Tax=Sphaerotilus montanus TaxID=522889 RepID=UPI003FA2F4B6
MTSSYVKTTLDGRQVEVINGWVCLDGQPETDEVVALEEHPNRQVIQRVVPLATHMAGRLPLTLAEASGGQAALRHHHRPFGGSPLAVSERLRRTAWQRAVADGVD